jgi:hypothetical protein
MEDFPSPGPEENHTTTGRPLLTATAQCIFFSYKYPDLVEKYPDLGVEKHWPLRAFTYCV